MDSKPLTARLAAVLNTQLEASNLSVSAASKKSGIPYTTLYRRLTNDGHGLTIEETERVAATLHTTPSDLLKQASH